MRLVDSLMPELYAGADILWEQAHQMDVFQESYPYIIPICKLSLQHTQWQIVVYHVMCHVCVLVVAFVRG